MQQSFLTVKAPISMPHDRRLTLTSGIRVLAGSSGSHFTPQTSEFWSHCDHESALRRATGLPPRAAIHAMHSRIRSEFAIDEMKACFRTDADFCSCRKPKPGMILAAATERAIDLSRSF